ncbi:MAG: nucleoside triphosphate pyrophosphohydrolase [Actinomycetota bacterium]|nr:nucleoside triphosphate pyrophosphohydrolase [Actinomycetota bacterium]
MARVILVQASARLPGLFPLQSWEALRSAEVVWTRAPDRHPSAAYLRLGEIPLVRLEPTEPAREHLDLYGAASPEERGYARALVDLATAKETAVYLLDPDDSDGFVRSVGLEATKAGAEVEFVFHLEPAGVEVLRLAEVERRLRDPEGGCPWDLQQDHASLGRYLVEETYELLDAIEHGSDTDIAEELGDVLLQVVFHAQVAADRGAFDLDDVARGIAEKLVRRHPHVFGDVAVSSAEEVKSRWEVLKQEEKQRTGPFDGIPPALPALLLADKLQRRAAKLGFDWPGPAAADRIRRELDALDRAVTPGPGEEQVGELLGATVGLARQLDVDPERALRRAVEKFRRRVEALLAAAADQGLDPASLERDRWLQLWDAVEAEDAARGPTAP